MPNRNRKAGASVKKADHPFPGLQVGVNKGGKEKTPAASKNSAMSKAIDKRLKRLRGE